MTYFLESSAVNLHVFSFLRCDAHDHLLGVNFRNLYDACLIHRGLLKFNFDFSLSDLISNVAHFQLRGRVNELSKKRASLIGKEVARALKK